MATVDPTTNYAWNLPEVSGSANTWGTELNAIIGDDETGIDAVVKAISDVANAAMPKAGGTFTGDVGFSTNVRVTENAKAFPLLDIDLSQGNFFYKSLDNGAQTLTFSNPPGAGTVQFFTLELRQNNGGNSTVTWPASVRWEENTPPTLSTTNFAYDVLVFYTRDGGNSYFGAHSMANIPSS